MKNVAGRRRRVVLGFYAVAMISLIVGVDVIFFRHHFVERLAANISIVLIFVVFYFRFLRIP